MKPSKHYLPRAIKRQVIRPSQLMAEMRQSTRSATKVWLLLALCAWGVLAISVWVKP